MSKMFVEGLRVHQNVIQITKGELVEEGLEHLGHQGREGGWGIDETEAHYHPLKVTQRGRYGCLRDILLGHTDLMESTGKVDLAEVPRTSELV